MALDKGIYRSTPPTIRNGEEEQMQLDINGNLKVVSPDVSSADTARTVDTPVLPVQHVDAAGNVGGVTDTPYAQKITEGSGVVYVAIAPIGTAQATAGWRAKKITVSGADTIITWAGSGAFNQVATDLTALTYA